MRESTEEEEEEGVEEEIGTKYQGRQEREREREKKKVIDSRVTDRQIETRDRDRYYGTYLSNLTYLLPSKKGKDKDLREVRRFQVVEDLMR